jgi:FkbM family methyltransferase
MSSLSLKRVFPASWHYRLSQIKRAFFGYRTYAQFGEDKVLAELFKGVNTGRYVDVGAHHPYRYSNTYLLYKKGWHGVNIDPNPYTITLFNKARPGDTNICSGVGNAGELTYYRFSDPAVNTFKKEEADKWKGKQFLAFLGTTPVEVKPLSVLVQGPIDLLTIDAEGMDLEVLQSYDWKVAPKVIVIEGNDSKPFLLEKGYRLHTVCGASNIFVHNTYHS